MDIQNREAYDQIFFTEDARKIYPMARYMMQLEEFKDLAISFVLFFYCGYMYVYDILKLLIK